MASGSGWIQVVQSQPAGVKRAVELAAAPSLKPATKKNAPRWAQKRPAAAPTEAPVDPVTAPVEPPREEPETPPAMADTSTGKPNGKKRKPRHSGDTARVVDSYPDELAKQIAKARNDYTRTQRDLRHPVVPQNQWLYDWCCDNGIDTSKTFPVAFDGEDFCDRAQRFGGAMRKRRSRRA